MPRRSDTESLSLTARDTCIKPTVTWRVYQTDCQPREARVSNRLSRSVAPSLPCGQPQHRSEIPRPASPRAGGGAPPSTPRLSGSRGRWGS